MTVTILLKTSVLYYSHPLFSLHVRLFVYFKKLPRLICSQGVILLLLPIKVLQAFVFKNEIQISKKENEVNQNVLIIVQM